MGGMFVQSDPALPNYQGQQPVGEGFWNFIATLLLSVLINLEQPSATLQAAKRHNQPKYQGQAAPAVPSTPPRGHSDAAVKSNGKNVSGQLIHQHQIEG
jgi:hypothetical protein